MNAPGSRAQPPRKDSPGLRATFVYVFRSSPLLRAGSAGRASPDAWREALRCKPDSVDIKLNLGIANIALGNESDAESFWLSILNTDPNHIQTLINLGLFYRERDRNQEAHDF